MEGFCSGPAAVLLVGGCCGYDGAHDIGRKRQQQPPIPKLGSSAAPAAGLGPEGIHSLRPSLPTSRSAVVELVLPSPRPNPVAGDLSCLVSDVGTPRHLGDLGSFEELSWSGDLDGLSTDSAASRGEQDAPLADTGQTDWLQPLPPVPSPDEGASVGPARDAPKLVTRICESGLSSGWSLEGSTAERIEMVGRVKERQHLFLTTFSSPVQVWLMEDDGLQHAEIVWNPEHRSIFVVRLSGEVQRVAAKAIARVAGLRDSGDAQLSTAIIRPDHRLCACVDMVEDSPALYLVFATAAMRNVFVIGLKSELWRQQRRARQRLLAEVGLK
mmetsp:Transcript_41454/g.109045  ORF Transcript_41454/g.109045 Transcript_41454/m.109045 type:complete len:327 (+) Transcript_41454:30-1010(+)